MNKKTNHITFTACFIACFFSFMFWINTANAQSDVTEAAKTALIKGDVAALSSYFSDPVELNLQEIKENYSKTQATFVLKSFLQKYPPITFDYVHQGSSKKGIHYTIGKYTYKGGSFRVYMLIKENNGQNFINTLDFGEE
jgi:hypothetical protein